MLELLSVALYMVPISCAHEIICRTLLNLITHAKTKNTLQCIIARILCCTRIIFGPHYKNDKCYVQYILQKLACFSPQ